jgi:hypothetical protein
MTTHINKMYVKGLVTTNVAETITLESCIQKTNIDYNSTERSEHDVNMFDIHSVILKEP